VIWRITVPGQPRQKFTEIPSQQKKSRMWCYTLSSHYSGKCKMENQHPGQPGQKARLYLKNKQSKSAEGMVQGVDHPLMSTKPTVQTLVPPHTTKILAIIKRPTLISPNLTTCPKYVTSSIK
jgi:hypothetical protein